MDGKNVLQKKRGRPATGQMPHLVVRVFPEDLAEIDIAAEQGRLGESRSEVVRLILADWADRHRTKRLKANSKGTAK